METRRGERRARARAADYKKMAVRATGLPLEEMLRRVIRMCVLIRLEKNIIFFLQYLLLILR